MEELDQRTRRAAEGLPIAVLAVFGSRARGRERPESDLDVAVLPEDLEELAAAMARLLQ